VWILLERHAPTNNRLCSAFPKSNRIFSRYPWNREYTICIWFIYSRYLYLRSCIDCRFRAGIFKAFPARSDRESVFVESGAFLTRSGKESISAEKKDFLTRERERAFQARRERDFRARRTKRERVQTIFTSTAHRPCNIKVEGESCAKKNRIEICKEVSSCFQAEAAHSPCLY
jgi:hypothetical protein